MRDPEVDAVYIASPVHLHLKHIRLAAAHGKHVLCEKPLTLTVVQARKALALRSNKRGAGWESLGDGSHQRQTLGV